MGCCKKTDKFEVQDGDTQAPDDNGKVVMKKQISLFQGVLKFFMIFWHFKDFMAFIYRSLPQKKWNKKTLTNECCTLILKLFVLENVNHDMLTGIGLFLQPFLICVKWSVVKHNHSMQHYRINVRGCLDTLSILFM